MELTIFLLCLAIDIFVIIDFFKPLLKWKYLKTGFKIKLISPLWNYFVLFLAFLGIIYSLLQLISDLSINNVILFNMLFIVEMFEIPKSYVIFCKDGLFIAGTYFSNTEKQAGQYIARIMIWNRRIYAIKTESKFSYIYLRKKYIDELTE